ncbi:MAG: methyltransferase [Planctomycetota bacterium]|nr:methyltransferase [Planctomycetota bacterium]
MSPASHSHSDRAGIAAGAPVYECGGFTSEARRSSKPATVALPFDQASLPGQDIGRIDPLIRDLCLNVQLRCPSWVSAANPDARAFAQLAISLMRPSDRALDLGTGTGLLAICLAKLGRSVVAADISASALRTASRNARRNAVHIKCRRTDLLSAIEGRFDWIAFNPPYSFRPDSFVSNVARNLLRRVPWIRRGATRKMPAAVRTFRLRLLERFISNARRHLAPQGCVLIHVYETEVGPLQRVLPIGLQTRIMRHAGMLKFRTVGLMIRERPRAEGDLGSD